MIKHILIAVILFGQHAFAASCRVQLGSPKIVLISGTDRQGSNTLKVTRQVEAIMKAQGHDVTLLSLADIDPSQLRGDYFNPPETLKATFIPTINQADGIIFVFPEYNGGYPGVLKTLIDYTSSPEAYARKPIGMITISAGMLGGQKGAESWSGIMRHLKADVIGESLVIVPHVDKEMSHDQLHNSDLIKRISSATEAIVKRSLFNQQLRD